MLVKKLLAVFFLPFLLLSLAAPKKIFAYEQTYLKGGEVIKSTYGK